ncbi:MAG: hypothetical protein ACRDWD_06055 [Acidimicrobiia bacterium]
MRSLPVITLAVATAFVFGLGCDDDAGDAVNQVQEKAGEAGARAAAEGLRASLKTQGENVKGGLCNTKTLRAAVDNLPGDPEIKGIDDGNDDGVDDDCYVQVTVADQSACVTVPKSGTNVDVNGGTCPNR